MTKIYKSEILVTVFHEALAPDYAAAIFSGMSLADISAELDDGAMLGAHALINSTLVPKERLAAELHSVGNDGAFFDYTESDDE